MSIDPFDTEVTNPKLIVAVGTAGLVSNIVGLFLFHDHGGHSHGGGGHSHGGSSKSHANTSGGHSHSKQAAKSHGHSHGDSTSSPTDRTPLLAGGSSSAAGRATTSGGSSTIVDDDEEDEDVDSELGEAQDAIEDELFVHPGELRANVLKKAHDAGYGTTATTTSHANDSEHQRREQHKRGQSSLSSVGDGHDHSHEGHGGAGEASSDGSMNMRGVFLHVLGDAVGFPSFHSCAICSLLTPLRWTHTARKRRSHRCGIVHLVDRL